MIFVGLDQLTRRQFRLYPKVNIKELTNTFALQLEGAKAVDGNIRAFVWISRLLKTKMIEERCESVVSLHIHLGRRWI